MLYVRFNMFTAEPLRLGEVTKYIDTDIRPMIESQPGNLGMSLQVNPQLGVAVTESFWVSRDAMRGSEKIAEPSRREAARRAAGTATVERYQVPVFEQVAPIQAGVRVRMTRMDVDPAKMEQAIEAFGHTAIPWLANTDGFCGVLLLIDRRSGRLVSETLWQDSQDLAASRSAATAIRVDAVEATGALIQSIEEYSLVFSSAHKTLSRQS